MCFSLQPNVNPYVDYHHTRPDNCQSVVKNDPVFQSGRRLLDIIDLSIFDFLTGDIQYSLCIFRNMFRSCEYIHISSMSNLNTMNPVTCT